MVLLVQEYGLDHATAVILATSHYRSLADNLSSPAKADIPSLKECVSPGKAEGGGTQAQRGDVMTLFRSAKAVSEVWEEEDGGTAGLPSWKRWAGGQPPDIQGFQTDETIALWMRILVFRTI